MKSMAFAHLHVHSEYSVTDGICRIKELVQAAKANNMNSLAVTDNSVMFGAVKLVNQAHKVGIKPILAAEIQVQGRDEKPDGQLVLLAESELGYHNLSALLTRAQLENKDDKSGIAKVKASWLTKKATHGLFCLTGGHNGYINQALDMMAAEHARVSPEAQQRLVDLHKIFDDHLAVELTRCGRPYEEDALHIMVGLAAEMNLPVVATNDVRFMSEDAFEAHDIRQLIARGENANQHNRARPYSRQQYFKSTEEMLELFDDLPVAVENAQRIASRCNFTMTLGKNFLPRFATPAGYQSYPYAGISDRKALNEHLANCQEKWLSDGQSPQEVDDLLDESRLLISESWYGFERRWPLIEQYYQEEGLTPVEIQHKQREYEDRMITELEVVTGMGFPGYYLIVKDFIQWAKEQDIPVGPGRGSGAGSLVAYSTDITDLNPIPYDLLFERFLNSERVSMPDFDIDFCMNRRGEVIDYVAKRYGADRVSQIATMGTMAAKMVVKDSGRALGYNYNLSESISKLIPNELGITLQGALDVSEELNARYHGEDEVKEIIDYGLQLEGLTRSIGKHAGGVLIAPDTITRFSPLYLESEDATPVSQFDKNDVEEAGLVKFDFLGLRTLTILQNAVHHINAGQSETLDLNTISLKDDKTFELLKTAQTTAVFQLESSGMQGIVKRLQPSCFEDIIALVALYRPGPLQSGMVEDFIDRKHGLQPVAYPHPDFQLDILKPVLEPTYGIIVYQEQVMQIAQVMAGYTLGGADLLRRAMGKKKPEEMAKQRATFLEGCATNGIDEALAGNIFDLVEKFAGYGFNKSHSAGYGLLTYQTAYLKSHYPVQFMSAVLSSEADDQDKLVHLMGEVTRMGISIYTPDINQSVSAFTPLVDDNSILFGLSGIKGVGQAAIEQILLERQRKGAYKSLPDMFERLAGKRISSTVYQALIGSGALDTLGDRSALAASLSTFNDLHKKHLNAVARREKAMSQEDPVKRQKALDRIKHVEWPPALLDGEKTHRDLLIEEHKYLGNFISEHPFVRLTKEAKQYASHTISDITKTNPEDLRKEETPPNVRVAGILMGVATRKKGNFTMATIYLDDGLGRLEIPIFSRELSKFKTLLEGSLFQPILVSGAIKHDKYKDNMSIAVENIDSFNNIRDRHARVLMLTREVQEGDSAQEVPDAIRDALMQYRNGHTIVLMQNVWVDANGDPIVKTMQNGDQRGVYSYDQVKTHRVMVRDELLEILEKTPGISSVSVLGAIDREKRMKLDKTLGHVLNRESDSGNVSSLLKNEKEMQIREKSRAEQREKLKCQLEAAYR